MKILWINSKSWNYLSLKFFITFIHENLSTKIFVSRKLLMIYEILYPQKSHPTACTVPVKSFSRSWAATAGKFTPGVFNASINCCQVALRLVVNQYQNISLQHSSLSLVLLFLMVSRCDSWSSFSNITPNSYQRGVTRGTTKLRMFHLVGFELTEKGKSRI